jgi:hypothetical protein
VPGIPNRENKEKTEGRNKEKSKKEEVKYYE